jgi:hypothetical protein
VAAGSDAVGVRVVTVVTVCPFTLKNKEFDWKVWNWAGRSVTTLTTVTPAAPDGLNG